MGEVVAEKYRIERLLGSGGMAEVYAAVNERTDKRVALKWILPALSRTEEVATRFRREALAAGRIHHPNVVTIFDVVEHQGSTCLVMELLEGETVADRLSRTPQLPLAEAVALILPAMRGVAAAHAQGVVHRDLKPENIFICRDADGLARGCKVLDFGVSKFSVSGLDPGLDITLAGNLVGTPMYMAPEQVRGAGTIDHRMDVYSLGVVLYEMIAGRTPFVRELYSAVMVDIATSDPPPLSRFRPEIPRRLADVVARALERDVDRRYPNMHAFIRALEEVAREELHLMVGTPPQGLVTEISQPRPGIGGEAGPPSLLRTVGRRQLAWGIGLAIALAALALVWRWGKPYDVRKTEPRLAGSGEQKREAVPPPGVAITPATATPPAPAAPAAATAQVAPQPAAAGSEPPGSALPGAGERQAARGDAGKRSKDRGRAPRPRDEAAANPAASAGERPTRASDAPAGDGRPQTAPRVPRAGKLSVDDF